MNKGFIGRWTKPGRVAMAVAVAAMLAGTSIIPAAHASRAHAGVSLTFWAPYSGPDRDELISIVNGFNSSQSGVTVTYDQQNETGYGPKVTTALAAGKGPNMWVGDNVQMAGWVGQNQLAPLESAIKGSKVLTSKNFSSQTWGLTKFQGHTYSLPLDALPMTLYFNKARLKAAKISTSKPPVYSQKAFLATVKKLTKGGKYGFLVPDAWPIFLLYTSVLYQFGGTLFDISTKTAKYNSKAGVNALKALYDLVYKYKASPAKTGGGDPDMKLLPTGNIAMAVDGPWMSTHPSLLAMGKNAGIAQFPQIGPKKAVAFYSHYLVAYTKNSAEENKAIVKFAEYFNAHSLAMAKAGDAPMYKPVLASKAIKKLTGAGIAAMMKYAKPASPTFQKYRDSWLWDDVVIPALQGKLKPADFQSALNSAAAKTTQNAQGG
jgi:multiple sugar transport system substrate-binding protein